MRNITGKTMKLMSVALLLASSAFSARYDRKDDQKNDCKEERKEERTQGHMIKDQQMMGAYNASARYDVQSAWDFFLTGDILYWQQRTSNLELGSVTQPVSGSTLSVSRPITEGKILNPNFGWSPGLRIALGLNTEQDNWDWLVEWTHLVSKNNTSVSVLPADLGVNKAILVTRIHTDSNDTVINASTAKQSLSNVLNIIDMEMGRPFYNGKELTLKPIVGVRSSWIKNRENRTYSLLSSEFSALSNLNVKTKCNTWGIGPRFGLDSNWLLGYGFRFFGNVAGSVQYVSYNCKNVETSWNSILPSGQGTDGTVTSYKDSKSHAQLLPNVDTALGFGWGMYFDNSNWHLDFALAYEFNIFPSHYADVNYLDDINQGLFNTNYKNLQYHGGSFKLRFDF